MIEPLKKLKKALDKRERRDRKQRRVGLDERGDLRGVRDQAFHLAAVQGDREAAKAVDGDCALFRDFHRRASAARLRSRGAMSCSFEVPGWS